MNIKIVNLLICLVFLTSCKTTDEPQPTPGGGSETTQDITMPRKEMRGVWIASVSNIDWPKSSSAEVQKQEYIDYLDLFVKYHVNAVAMQIRPTADAFYNSPLEPWSQFITGRQGKDPGYDVLKFMIDEAHKRGLEFHAWMNPYRISNNVNTFVPSDDHVYKKHKEWTMVYDKLLMFRPALPEVQQFLVDVIDDLITKYDVDGIHFDDYFYPYPKTGFTIDDAGDFAKYGAGYANIEDFRRGNVNKVIESIHNLIVKKRPDVLFSISPYGVWRNKKTDPVNGSDSSSSLTNYDDLYADIRLWCEKGWIDMVVPQLYASTENIAMNFIKMTDWWTKNSFECPVVIGHGIYKFGNSAEGAVYMNPLQLDTQFFYARRNSSVQGSFLYNASVFKENKINILSNLEKIYADKTPIPFMGRTTLAAPKKVSNLTVSSKVLVWPSQGSTMRYIVYKIIDNKASVIDIITDNKFTCSEDGNYAVTAINGDNVESELSTVITVK